LNKIDEWDTFEELFLTPSVAPSIVGGVPPSVCRPTEQPYPEILAAVYDDLDQDL
jgi:hypothetical protein